MKISFEKYQAKNAPNILLVSNSSKPHISFLYDFIYFYSLKTNFKLWLLIFSISNELWHKKCYESTKESILKITK